MYAWHVMYGEEGERGEACRGNFEFSDLISRESPRNGRNGGGGGVLSVACVVFQTLKCAFPSAPLARLHAQ